MYGPVNTDPHVTLDLPGGGEGPQAVGTGHDGSIKNGFRDPGAVTWSCATGHEKEKET